MYPCVLCGKSFPKELLVLRDQVVLRCRGCNAEMLKPTFERMLPIAFRDTDLSRIPNANKVMAWKYGPKGLLIHGATGKGKSRTMWKLIERLMCVDGYTVIAFTGVSFGHELNVRYRLDEAEHWLEMLSTRTEIVFFDDLGKLKLTDRAEAELFGVVEARCSNLLPILVTTNDTGETMAKRMTEGRAAPLVRRLREFCVGIDF